MAEAASSPPAAPPSYDASLADHGFEALTARGLTYPLGTYAPEYGVVHRIAEGVGWTRMPMPGRLDHINVWLLDDDEGATIVDTGLNSRAGREAWDKALGWRRVIRVIVTHFHPDHIGLAGWLCETHGAKLWMSRTEFLMARMLTADVRDAPPPAALAQVRAAGWSTAQIDAMRATGWGRFAQAVSPLPLGHVRLTDGQAIRIGARDWRIVVGSGHTPEHACLVDDAGRLMIAGDQVLPKITSNVSLSLTEPDGDPLGDWMASITKFRTLPDDLLVLPAHGEPFTGLHARLDRLEEGHRISLERLHARLRDNPSRAVDCFGVLFGRAIDDNILPLATGEALAHLRHLELAGRAVREDRDGVDYYTAT